jgi:hypothetical protein
MDQNTKDMIWTLTKIGLVGTVIGVPVGVWAMKRWNRPGETWKTAALLTGVGFAVKEVMLHSATVAVEEAVAREEGEVSGYLPPGAVALSPRSLAFAANPRRQWGKPRRGYLPAPAPGVSPYYRGLKNMANGRSVPQSGLNPTAL